MSTLAPGGPQADTGPTRSRRAGIAGQVAGDGTRLAGRYRLRERLSEQHGSVEWRATDEVLARPVTARTLVPGSWRTREVMSAARAASRLDDPRLARVLDADDHGDFPYVVTEWPSGTQLGELLTTGPIEPWRAARIITQAAEAVAAAHQAGMAHLCLGPDSLWCDPQGEVRITGMGIAAALTGGRADDPALADTRDLARLLYAALTGYWPGPGQTALPPAPCSGGQVRCPGQVRSGIPAEICSVISRALAEPTCGPPIYGPAQLALELAALTCRSPATARSPGPEPPTLPLSATGPAVAPAPVMPVTLPMPPAARVSRSGHRTRSTASPRTAATRSSKAAAGRRAPRTWFAVITGVLAVIGVGGWLLATALTGPGRPATGSPAAHASTGAGVLIPVSAHAFGPGGEPDGDNPQRAHFAIDGNPATAWHTDWYTSARFGNLKAGTGLLLDMGRPVTVTGAQVTLGGIRGTDLQLRVGAEPVPAGMRQVARANDAGGVVRLRLVRPERDRYLLIWLTMLPPDASGTFQAVISNVTVYGQP